jgi:hypothetical protein
MKGAPQNLRSATGAADSRACSRLSLGCLSSHRSIMARACRSASSRHPKQNLADDSTPAG